MYFFDTKNWELNSTGPGKEIPLWILVPAAVAISFSFVIFLPAVGFGLLGYFVVKKISKKA